MNDDPNRQPVVVHYYRCYLQDQSSAAFIRSVSSQYDLGTLARLLTGGAPVVRRSAALALGMLGDIRINSQLGRSLRDDDRGVRMIAERAIRGVWQRDGNPAQQAKLRIAIRCNSLFQFSRAFKIASDVIEEVPWFSEAHHQRGIACACLGDFDDAIADFHQALELNGYHFPAAAAMGQAFLELGDQSAALECFQRALKLHPDLAGVRMRVSQLQRQLDET